MINKIDSHIPDFLLSPRFRIYRHLTLQIILVCITATVFADPTGELVITWKRFYAWMGCFAVTNLVVCFTVYVLTPHFLVKGRLPGYLIAVAGTILFSIFFIVLFQKYFYTFNETYKEAGPYMLLNVMSSIITLGLIIFGTSALLLFKYWMGHNQRIDELAASTLQSELKYLKKQINPHFLFNMLNNANVLIKKNPEEASRVLFKLEDLLRYQINDSVKEEVLLSSEIRFLNDFLNLEKIRRDHFEYIIWKEGDIDKISLPPLLFIPFVENAVKHNPDSDNRSYVYLSFKAWNNQLEFRCENSKPAITAEKNGVGGLGLQNIKRRLELLFPGHYTLEIKENEFTYTVNLQLT